MGMKPVGRKTLHQQLLWLNRTVGIMNLLMKVLVMTMPTAFGSLTLGHIHSWRLMNCKIIYRDRDQLTTTIVLIHAHSRSRQEKEYGQDDDLKSFHVAKIVIFIVFSKFLWLFLEKHNLPDKFLNHSLRSHDETIEDDNESPQGWLLITDINCCSSNRRSSSKRYLFFIPPPKSRIQSQPENLFW